MNKTVGILLLYLLIAHFVNTEGCPYFANVLLNNSIKVVFKNSDGWKSGFLLCLNKERTGDDSYDVRASKSS